jgi:hypothetical protein
MVHVCQLGIEIRPSFKEIGKKLTFSVADHENFDEF